MMITLSALNTKGGVGKSTLSTTLAAGLASKGKRVLLVDGSTQADATAAFRHHPNDGLAQLLLSNASWQKVSMPFSEHLTLLTGGKNTLLIPTRVSPVALRKRLSELESYLDYVVIDTSPTVSDLHISFYLASNYILIPTQCEFYSIQGVIRSIEHLNTVHVMAADKNLPVAAVLAIAPNMYQDRQLVQVENLAELRDRFGQANVLTPIKLRTAWKQAAQFRQPIFEFEPKSMAAREALRFVTEVEERLQ